MLTRYQRILLIGRLSLRFIWRRRNILVRATACFIIGIVSLYFSKYQSFDWRFKLREVNHPSTEIVLVDMSRRDWVGWEGLELSQLVQLKELESVPDSHYWNTQAWKTFLNNILIDNPTGVGVTFYFGTGLADLSPEELSSPVFNDPKVFWASRIDQEGRILLPSFSRIYNNNIGLGDFKADGDGIVRSFRSPLVQVPHLAIRLARLKVDEVNYITGDTQAINFQGPENTYTRVSFSDVVNQQVPKGFFTNKIVIVGTFDGEAHVLRTPLGPIARSEVIANVIDTLIGKKSIQRVSLWICILILLGLLVLCTLIISNFPHSVAFIFLVWLAVAYSAMSLWIFDEFFMWLPILPALIEIFSVFIIFLSYQLSLKDYQNWRLEQEKKSLHELEQLKDNFISLFSHDLKTPIAKIQAICDRIVNENPSLPITDDLQSLRRESQELFRYIQTILQLTRVESYDFKLNKESFDLNEIVKKVVDQLEPLAQTKNQVLEVHLEPLFLIEVDAQLVHEVVLNLLENAIKYTPEGGQILISTSELDEQVNVTIADNGPGIDVREQKRIFDKFYRGSKHLDLTKGSGLGLYLSKYFIELHGGQIWIESQLGKGTKIGFSLPV